LTPGTEKIQKNLEKAKKMRFQSEQKPRFRVDFRHVACSFCPERT
jgi:hypothetical protein